jgi:hypothetical protein
MYHLMRASRTWGCVFNVNSWCTYLDPDSACYAQDGARESEHFELVKLYRQAEQDYYLALENRHGRRRSNIDKYGAKMADLKARIFQEIGTHNLKVCAFYFAYKDDDHLAVINKIDKDIPRLLSLCKITIKGEKILV